MPLAEKQRQLIARFAVIDDAHERLAAIVASGQRWPEVAEDERTDDRRVPGCVSAVWLTGAVEDGRCCFRMSAASSVVKGIAALLAALYEGEKPADVLAWEPGLVGALGLDRQLSPTRLNVLAHIRRAIRGFAAAQ